VPDPCALSLPRAGVGPPTPAPPGLPPSCSAEGPAEGARGAGVRARRGRRGPTQSAPVLVVTPVAYALLLFWSSPGMCFRAARIAFCSFKRLSRRTSGLSAIGGFGPRHHAAGRLSRLEPS
jgi:hypothetical protein